MGVDNISSKLFVMAADIIAGPVTNLISGTMLRNFIFPDVEQEASVTPVFKKEDRKVKTNYRPISVLNVFPKIFERFLLNQRLPFADNTMSSFLSAIDQDIAHSMSFVGWLNNGETILTIIK